MGEAHDGLVSDGMTCERVHRQVSYVGIGCRHSDWNVALVWDEYMLAKERVPARLRSACCALYRMLLWDGGRTCCVPISCSRLDR